MTNLVIRGQWGLGDNIFARPFVRNATKIYNVYLETPWPELYEGLDVKFVRGTRKLRTQMRNVEAQDPSRWADPPKGAKEYRVGYTGDDLVKSSLVRTLERHYYALGVPARDLVWDLPDMGKSPITCRKPIALIRPVTVRAEWRNEARNPKPEYIDKIARSLADTHLVVAVADLEDKREWCETIPFHHHGYLRGQLDTRRLLALVAEADVIVGGVGWIVPASIALKKKAFIVLGGHGGHNAPHKITDHRMDLSNIGFAFPERFCSCSNMLHRCTKDIPDLSAQWQKWISSFATTDPKFSIGMASSDTMKWRRGVLRTMSIISPDTKSKPTATLVGV